MDKGIVPDFEIVAPTGAETNFVFEEQLNGFKNRYEAPTIQGLIDLIEAHRLYLKNRSIKKFPETEKPSTDSAN